MKERILEFLACPKCKGDLALEVFDKGGDEVKTGNLSCSECSVSYPIRNFIPRFINTDEYADNFSFQWNKFHDIQIDILNNTAESERTFRWKTGWGPEELDGKLILDAGVGAGRFADVASRWGGEVFGVDLSFAVEAAYKNIGDRENVHIIQADLFNMPFRKELFNHIYSIGVLHHTPDTERAFKAVSTYLKQGGEFAVFIYTYSQYHYFSDIWRRITTRIPTKLLYYFSSIAIPLFYLHKIPFLGKIINIILPTSDFPDSRWRWLDTFDWYSPMYQWKHTWPEVFRWYKEEGFSDIELFQEDNDYQICMRGKKA